jgi:DNA-binding transcriptional regulator LsrR (DeoR family)
MAASEMLALDDEAHFVARVAWYYYVEGINQQAIADRLTTNRLHINQARRDTRSNGCGGWRRSARYSGG